MASNLELSDRKLRILQFIIQEYIETAEPVGSRTISKNKTLGVSAATIRNEMADLEEMGLLLQPHTSAGRIPSHDRYRLYVDKLMGVIGLNKKEKDEIEGALVGNIEQIQELLEDSLALLTQITNYTSVAISQKVEKSKKIKQLNLVHIDSMTAVLIMVMEDGTVRNSKFKLSVPVSEEKLELISRTLNDNIRGKIIEDFDMNFINYIKHQIKEYNKIFDDMFTVMKSNMDKNLSFNVLLNGATNIFNFPEFSDIGKAKSFLNLLEQKNELASLLEEKGIRKGNVNIIIGDDSIDDVLGSCSIITTEYEYKGKTIGKLGIIGPKRMDYDRAYSVMNYITKRLNKLMNNT